MQTLQTGPRVPLVGAVEIFEDGLDRTLRLVGIDPETWSAPEGERNPYLKLCKELQKGECTLCYGFFPPIKKHILLRVITTITIRISYHFREDPKLLKGQKTNPIRSKVLQEFRVMPDGNKKARPFQNSVSEKLRSNWEAYDPKRGVARALREELNITVSSDELEPPYLLSMVNTYELERRRYIRSGYLVEADFHPSGSLPGIYTLNNLIHFIWIMPEWHYKKKGYAEKGTNHVFRWRLTFNTSEELHEDE
jgi:hypothetical protein